MHEPEYYTTAEAAERLRIKPGSVSKAIKRGQLPAIRAGHSKRWLIKREDLDALFAPPPPHQE